MKAYLWTKLKSRLQFIKSDSTANYNWLFLAGGPGLGSESLAPLSNLLTLPGTIWHLDLPGDGSNLTIDDESFFAAWADALLEAVSAFENVILVAHSTGGMYALSVPELETHLRGLVLMSSAPDALWQEEFIKYVLSHPLDSLTEARKNQLTAEYQLAPNNDLLKEITLCCASYSFTPKGLTKGIDLFKTLPYNFRSCLWSEKNFDSNYSAKWIPQRIPTLIFNGEEDKIVRLKYFIQDDHFKRKNIKIQSIPEAGHYPWLDNPDAVVEAFRNYCKQLANDENN